MAVASRWLFNEDRAMREKFKSLRVDDVNAPADGRPVLVRYVDPEVDVAKLTYPIILLERRQMLRAEHREHRGRTPVMYWPEGVPDNPDDSRLSADTAPVAEFPVPMDILYEVTVMCRRANHQTELATKMAYPQYLPARFGFLEIPEDGTVRSLDLDGGPEYSATKDESGKRLLVTKYVVRIPTEIPPTFNIDNPVTDINVEIEPK